MGLKAEIIKDRIREKIEDQGLTVASLERKAGCRSSSLRQFLTGFARYPGLETIYNVAEALGCSIDELTGRKSPQKKKKKFAWNEELFLEIIESIKKHVNESNYSPTFEQFSSCTEEAYYFAMENNDGKSDTRFIKWIVDKIMSDILD